MPTKNRSNRVSCQTWRFLAFTLCLVCFVAQALVSQEISRKIIFQTPPAVPPLARKLHLIGKVKLEIVIAPSGAVTSAKLQGGSPVFEQNAIQAAKQWKFEAADKETKGVIIMEFKIE